jgi:hypothetical protein
LAVILDNNNHVELQHLGNLDTDQDGVVDRADQVAAPTGLLHEVVDPGSQTYKEGQRIAIETYKAGDDGCLMPVRFAPADPGTADVALELVAEFHDGTAERLVQVKDGSTQSIGDIYEGLDKSNSGQDIRRLKVRVNNFSGADVTEDLGPTTTLMQAHARGNGSVAIT